jgi:hypothetical protein
LPEFFVVESLRCPVHEIGEAIGHSVQLSLTDRCMVVAPLLNRGRDEVPAGMWGGSTENKAVVRALLVDLDPVGRGLDFRDGPRLVIDGAKPLAAAVQRCSAGADSDE